MWIDAKDTIDQWLEAQVTNIRDNQIYIHYNGWGARWDEWIEISSHRIAVFRTHTVQNPKANYLSPVPNIMPDPNQRLPQQQYVEHNLSKTIVDICKTVNDTTQLLTNFKNIRENKNIELSKEEEKIQETSKVDKPDVIMENAENNGQPHRQIEEEKKEEENIRGS